MGHFVVESLETKASLGHFQFYADAAHLFVPYFLDEVDGS